MILHPGYFPVNNWELPRGWVTKQLGELADIMQGGRLGLTKEEDYGKGQIPAYSAAGQDGQVAQAEYDRDGVVLSAIGARCGRCFFASGKWTTLANVQAILPNPARLSARYLFYRTNIEGFWPKSGSAQPFIKPSDIAKCWLAFPDSLEEQGRIVRVLDTVDAAIAKTEAVIAKLKCVRAGLLHDLLTRGLDAYGQLRPPPDQAPQLYDHSPLGSIPKAWEWGPLRDRASRSRPYLKTGPFGSSLKQEHWVQEGVPVVTIGSLGEGQFVFPELLHVSPATARGLSAYALFPGDIVFSRVADVGRSVVVRKAQRGWIMSSNMMWISLDQTAVIPEYLQLHIASNPAIRSQIRALVNTGGRDVANAQIMNSLVFPWPNRQEQILATKRVCALDEAIGAADREVTKLVRLKSGLTSDLLTGRLRVPSEVADVLAGNREREVR